MSKFLNKEQILGISDLKTEIFHVDAWDCDVRLRTLCSKERDAFERSLFSDGVVKEKTADMENFRAKLVALVLVDEKGQRMFTNDTDVLALGKKSAMAMDAIFAKAQKMNGLTAKDVDELTKK
jgi:hypothetical protein